RERGGADPQPRRPHRRALVERDRVAVDGDADLREAVLRLLAVEAVHAEIDEHKVDVGAAGEYIEAALLKHLAEGLRVRDRLPLALPEEVARGDPQADRLGRDDVLEGAALLAGEDRLVDRMPELLLAEDQAGAWAAECLVGGRRDDVGVGHGARVLARRDKP